MREAAACFLSTLTHLPTQQVIFDMSYLYSRTPQGVTTLEYVGERRKSPKDTAGNPTTSPTHPMAPRRSPTGSWPRFPSAFSSPPQSHTRHPSQVLEDPQRTRVVSRRPSPLPPRTPRLYPPTPPLFPPQILAITGSSTHAPLPLLPGRPCSNGSAVRSCVQGGGDIDDGHR